MTILSFPSTDINFDRNQSVLIQTADIFVAPAYENMQPRITKFEISNLINTENYSESKIFSKTVPLPIKIAYWSFATLSIFFISQFILTFFNYSILSGFSGLVGFVGFFGLFRVTQRIRSEIIEKGFIK